MRIKLFLITILLLIAESAYAQQPVRPTGALMYLGTWPNKILVIDEAKQQVIDEIKLETGAPLQVVLAQDKKKLFILTTKMGIEVVELATRKVTSHFDLNEGNRHVYPLGAAADPPVLA